MTAIRESILDNVKTTVEGIDGTGDYVTTMQSVRRYDVERSFPSAFPGAFVVSGRQDPANEASDHQHWLFGVTVNVFAMHDTGDDARTSDEILSELIADVQRAMMVDRTRGGYAVTTRYGEVEPFPVYDEPEGNIVEAAVGFEILFRHRIGDPGALS